MRRSGPGSTALASRLRGRPARLSPRSCVPSTSAGGRSSRHRASRPTNSELAISPASEGAGTTTFPGRRQIMQTHANLQVADHAIEWTLDQQRHEARRPGARILDVLRACADGYAAAAEYQELSRLSKAELERRGIPRGDL